jgi:4-amino-4-deoxy-L-arabinose transferase-like glycosyltransferase
MNISNRRVFLLVFLVAFLFRSWSVPLGLPFLYHPDEANLVEIATNIVRNGDLNPHYFQYPSLYFYLQAFAYFPYLVIQKWMGIAATIGGIPSSMILTMGVGKAADPALFQIGRLLTSAFAGGAVALSYLIAQRISQNTQTGLLAGFLFLMSPTNDAIGPFVTPTTFMVFFVLLSFFGSVLIYQEGKTWNYLLAASAAGLATSSKYNGIFALSAVLLAHFLKHGREGFRQARIYLAVGLSGLVFLLTTPYAALDYPAFIRDVKFQSHHYSTGHAGFEGDSLRWYLNYLWRVEGLVVLVGVFQVLLGTLQRHKYTLLLAVFPVLYFPFICGYVVRNFQTVLPITPFVLMLAAVCLVKNWAIIQTPQPKKVLAVVAGIAVLSLVIVPPFVTTLKNRFVRDNRESARLFLEGFLPKGTRFALESYAPFLDPERYMVKGFTRLIDQPPIWYKGQGFQYLVSSQAMYGRFFLNPQRYRGEVFRYEELFRSFELIKSFPAGDFDKLIHMGGGYEIRIYRVSNHHISQSFLFQN